MVSDGSALHPGLGLGDCSLTTKAKPVMMQQAQLGLGGDSSDIESEDDDDDISIDTHGSDDSDKVKDLADDSCSKPFANEVEASKSLRNYTR